MFGAPCLCAHLVRHFLPDGETHSSAVYVVAAEDWPGQVGTQPLERTPRKKGEAPGRLHRYTPREIPGDCTEKNQQEPGGRVGPEVWAAPTPWWGSQAWGGGAPCRQAKLVLEWGTTGGGRGS